MAEAANTGTSRGFDAGATSFTVGCADQAVVAQVEAMFADLPAAGDAVHLFSIVDDEGWAVHTPTQQISVANGARALAMLATSVNRLALDEDPDRLHLHCAALGLDGVRALISAPSGTGKSTLAAAMAGQGWTYLTDEAVALDGDAVTAFNKPILLKPGATELLGIGDIGVELPDSPVERAVPASALGAPLATEMVPNVVVILARNPDGTVADTPQVSPLHPADAAVSLLEQSMDPERYGPTTLHALLELTTRCACFGVVPGKPPDTAAALASLDTATTPLAVDAVSSPASPDGVVSYLVGDRVAVHDTNGGAIAALDEAGSAVWLALHGRAPAWYPAEQLHDPRTRPFLDRLVSLGLIHDTAVNEVTP